MRIKRNDADVLYCGTLVAEGLITLEIEEYFGIPHSTTHWLIIHKLQKLDIDLWDKCLVVLQDHKRHGGRKIHDWTADWTAHFASTNRKAH